MAGKEEINPLVPQIAGALAILFGGIATAVSGFKVGRRNATALIQNNDKTSETTILVKQIDDRQDFSHIQQAAIDAGIRERAELRDEAKALKLEIVAFRCELDKAKGDFLDYREKLGIANVEIKEQKGQILTQQAQITALIDENLRRKQEHEAMITRLHDENKELRTHVDNLHQENKSLRAELQTLQSVVHGNSKDIHDIGSIEVKVNSSKGSVDASLQALAQEEKEPKATNLPWRGDGAG